MYNRSVAFEVFSSNVKLKLFLLIGFTLLVKFEFSIFKTLKVHFYAKFENINFSKKSRIWGE